LSAQLKRILRLCARRLGREAQGTPSAKLMGQVAGWPFLWFVSFGHAKEMIPTAVREPHQNQIIAKAIQNN
jgi:hypothetical protein